MNNIIEITVNQVKTELPQNSTILYLLQHKKIDTTGIAVALNQNIVPKQKWDNTVLQHNDKVLIIHASQGG